MTKETLKILYYAHIYSHITYGLVLWGNMVSTVSLNSLQKIQNTCFSLITNLSPTLENYKQEKILKVQQLLTLENNKIGYQMDKALLPSNVSDLLWTDSRNKSLKKTHGYQTRTKHLPKFPKVTKTKYHQGFQLACLRSYGKISPEIRNSPTLASFVKKLKDQMLTV